MGDDLGNLRVERERSWRVPVPTSYSSICRKRVERRVNFCCREDLCVITQFTLGGRWVEYSDPLLVRPAGCSQYNIARTNVRPNYMVRVSLDMKPLWFQRSSSIVESQKWSDFIKVDTRPCWFCVTYD